MKQMKMLGLAVVAAAVLTAIIGAGSASAVLCTENKNPCPTAKVYNKKTHGPLDFSTKKGTSMVFATTAEEPIATCTESNIAADVESGNESTPDSGPIEELTFGGGCNVSTVTLGTLTVHNISGTSNGTVTINGTKLTINSPLLGDCNYGFTVATDIGTIKGGTEATWSINGVVTEVEPKRILCPDTIRWIAEKVHTTSGGKPLYSVPTKD